MSRLIDGRSFQDLDRRTRAELLSLDGAMVLAHTGTILAAGSIIEVPAGSVGGGGRTAAARRFSTLGLGVKVSQDGTITAYRNSERIFRASRRPARWVADASPAAHRREYRRAGLGQSAGMRSYRRFAVWGP